MQIAQDKQPADQHRGETHRTGQNRAPTASGHHGWTVVTTTDHGGSHSQAVPRPWWPSPSPNCYGFSCDASISNAIIAWLLLGFSFKWSVGS